MAEWMKNVSNDTKLGQLSIPGTHNSAAHYTALPSVQCQSANVSEQLNHGVRFLDFRVGGSVMESLANSRNGNNTHNVPEALRVVHGKFPLKLLGSVNLKDVLEDVYRFLDTHSSETVIVSLKPEGMVDFPDNTFADVIWHSVISPAKDRWYLGNTNPKLGDCRGKAVLFRRFSCDSTKDYNSDNFGIHAVWGYNVTSDDRGTMCVQDYCELKDTPDLDKKKQYIADQVSRASQFNQTTSSPDKMFVNFCTGSNFFNPECWPEPASKKLLSGLESKIGRGCGLVIVDYADENDWAIVRKIVESN